MIDLRIYPILEPWRVRHNRLGGFDMGSGQASGADVIQEPTEQPCGVLDCAVRDPAGNLIRIQDLR
jgi:hypothetical protein